MDFESVCRTCFRNVDLIPIFGDSNDKNIYFNAIYNLTGIKVTKQDGLPQNICRKCRTFLEKTSKFNMKAKRVHFKLLRMKKEIKNCTFTKTPITPKAIGQDFDTKCFKRESNISEHYKDLKNEMSDLFEDATTFSDDELPLKEYIINEELTEKEYLDTVEEKTIELQTSLDGAELKDLVEVPYEIKEIDGKTQRVNCRICYKTLSIRSIDYHIAKKHPGSDARKVKCEICSKFIMKNKLYRHKLLNHGEDGAKVGLKCGYCKSLFPSKDELLEHNVSCTFKVKKKTGNANREVVECDVCKKKMQKSSLKLHKEVTHAGLGKICEHCGRKFASKLRLSEHCRAKHGYEKFKCQLCEFQCSAILALRNHERRHRGEKPFSCVTCGASFHAAYLLLQHKHSHNTERNVKCDQCSATFKSNNSLHVHRQSCHSQSLFQCWLCDRAYSCRHYAVKHLRHYHEYKGPIDKLAKKEDSGLILNE